jgi:hypothetical protein
MAVKEISGTGRLYLRFYNARGVGQSDDLVNAFASMGGLNAADPLMPDLVWPINSNIIFDMRNDGVGTGVWHLFFFGFKLYDRGKAPC